MRAGVASVLSQVPDLDFTEVEQDASTLVEVLGAHYTVTQVFQGTEVPEDLATELQGYGADFSGEARAADGETLVVAVIRADAPDWTAGESRRAPETETRILLDGNPVGQLSLRLSPGDQTTVALSVPEDVQPDDLVLDVAQGGANQQLSLVDGSRTGSDVEHIYARATEVSIGDPSAWEVGFTGFTTNRLNATDDDETTATVVLEDGTTQRWLEDPSSLTHRFDQTVWYQVPAESEAAELALDIIVKAGISDPKSLDQLEVPLTFTGSAGA